MRFGQVRPQVGVIGLWEMIEETTLSSATNLFTFSGLTGDTAEVYKIVVRTVGGNGNSATYLTFNGDTTSSNYGQQTIQAEGASVTSARSTSIVGIILNNGISATSRLGLAEALIYAKSGNERIVIPTFSTAITGTTIDRIASYGSVWNNTADEITSINVRSNLSNGLGIGTYIALYRKVV